ncbi:MAG TPA: hypothetical protein VFZ61_25695 [Polyangiales bacterium]
MSVRVLRAVALGVVIALAVLWWILPRGVAELRAKAGRVERDRSAVQGEFSAAQTGDVFEMGDGLRTGASASAEVTLTAGPLLKVRAATLVRFRGARGGVAKVEVQGEVSIYTVEEPLLLETAAGLVRIAPRSRAVVREEGGETRVDVVLGRAELEWASATRRALQEGEGARFDAATRATRFVRTAQASLPTDAPQPADAPREPTAPEPAAERSQDGARARAVDAGVADDEEPAPAPDRTHISLTPDVRLAPAELLTLLDPAPPTQLGFVAPSCAGETVLEVERRGRFAPQPEQVHAFEVGLTRYRLRCGARLLRSGRVRVVKDAGHRPLAELPPQNQIEADGRAYTVLYQTRLPAIRVRWGSADGPSRLVVVSGGRQRDFPAAAGQADLPSGALDEGHHTLWFERNGTDLRSRTTQLDIQFDNATPLARFSQEVSDAADGSVRVSGVVVTGARVSVAGAGAAQEPVLLDAAGRFQTRVQPTPERRGFAVMVELPRRSVVYYVRRFPSAITPP